MGQTPRNKLHSIFLKACLFRVMVVEVCDRVIKGRAFDRIVVTVIILNSLFLAIDDYNLQNSESKQV